LVAFYALRDKAPSAPFPLLEDTMTTLRRRSLVSSAAAVTLALTLGGCVSAPSRLVVDDPAPAEGLPTAFRFDNEAQDYVHVYLITPQREWLLGRVEAGARATLRLPDAAVAEGAGSVRLAVLVGERVTQQAAASARAVISIPEAATTILSQRWTFSNALAQGQLTPLPRGRAPVEGVHR
jgi:ABC-type uncharacterized transport system auxiliary subunit